MAKRSAAAKKAAAEQPRDESGSFVPKTPGSDNGPEAPVETPTETVGETDAGTAETPSEPSRKRPRRRLRKFIDDDPIAPEREVIESQSYEKEVDRRDVHVVDQGVRSALQGLAKALPEGALGTWKVAWWVVDDTGTSSYIATYPLVAVMRFGPEEFARRKFGGGHLRWSLKKGGNYVSKKDIPPQLRESTQVSGHLQLAGRFRPPQGDVAPDGDHRFDPRMVDQGEALDINTLMKQQADAFEKGMEVAGRKEGSNNELLMMMMQQSNQQFQFMMTMMQGQQGQQLEGSRIMMEMMMQGREKESKMYEHFIGMAGDLAGGGDKPIWQSVLEHLPSVMEKGKELVQSIPTPQPQPQPRPRPVALPKPGPTEDEKGKEGAKAMEKLIEEIESGFVSKMPPDLLADTLSYKITQMAPFVWDMIKTNPDDVVIGFLGQAFKQMRGQVFSDGMKQYIVLTLQSIREGLTALPEDAPAADGPQAEIPQEGA